MRGLEFLLLGLLFIACGLTGSFLLETNTALLVAIVGMILVLFSIFDLTADETN